MPVTISTWGGIGGPGGSGVVPPYWVDFLRANLYPSLYFRQLGTQVSIPRGYGSAAKIPRWKSPFAIGGGVAKLSAIGAAGNLPSAVAQAPTEGTPSILTARGLCAEVISGSTIQFIGIRAYSDKLILVSHANFVEGALESLVRELAFKMDRYTRLNISANSTLRHPKSKALTPKSVGTDTLIGKNVARIAPYMDASMTPRWPDMTQVMLTHPLAQFDVFSDISANGFVSVARYNDAQMIYRGEIGQMYGIRFLLTNTLPLAFGSASTSATTFGLSGGVTGVMSYVVAPDAYYTLEQEGGGMEVIHHPPGSGGSTGDPANQYGSVAVKIHYGVIPAPTLDRRLIRWGTPLGATY